MNGTFLVDADLGRNTEFGIYVEDDEEHQIKLVTFQDSELKLYGPYTIMSFFYDSVNLKQSTLLWVKSRLLMSRPVEAWSRATL